MIPEAIVARASQWQRISQIQKNGSGGRSIMLEWLEGHFIRNMPHPSDCHTTATRLPLQSSEKSDTIANDCHTIATVKNRGNETCMGEEFGYYMSCDMPGPWDAECAVLYLNMQWQSLAIVGNRVAIEWQSNNTGDGHLTLARSPKPPGKWWASCPKGGAHEHKPEICITCFRHEYPPGGKHD